MEYFRISKYNPKYRDENDIYRKKEDWTEYFMVKDKKEFIEDYMFTEQKYIDFLTEILNINQSNVITFNGLQLWENNNIKYENLLFVDNFINYCLIDNKNNLTGIDLKGLINKYKGYKVKELLYNRLEWEDYGCYILKDKIELDEILFNEIFKLALRGFAGLYYFKGKNIKIRFGYDFYLYLSLKNSIITKQIIEKYNSKGIFIEKRDDFKIFF